MKSTPLATSNKFMVSSAHPLATEVGASILEAGGNAFDAAVAIAAALNVVEPMMSGIGGYGTVLIYDAMRQECRFLNSSDRFPRQVNSDLFRPPTPGFQENRRGAKAVSTPGNVRAWQALSQSYGRLPWRELLQPAVELAGKGFPVGTLLAHCIRREFAHMPAHAQRIFGRDGRPLVAQALLIQHELAQSLAQIAAEGADAFYVGALGQGIVAAVQEAGGFLDLPDLARCQADWFQPIAIDYRGHRVVTASPPATAFAALIRLGLMSQFDLATLGHNSPAFLHCFAEASKHAFGCRLKYAADPGVSRVPLDTLLSPAYWQRVVSSLNLSQAQPFETHLDMEDVSPHTTHFVVADSAGNIVSATQTIGQLFGSRLMPAGTGIWLNNSLEYCTFLPKGNPMDAHPGRRKLSGDCPVILFREGLPWAALGTPGGHTIPQTVPQMVMNLVDFGMDMAEAIARPRISFAEPDRLLVDPTLAAETREALLAMGHRVTEQEDGLGNGHGLTIAYDEAGRPQRFTGAADPRGEGVAAGA